MEYNKDIDLFKNKLPTNFGYSLTNNIKYNKKDMKVPPFRLKEWDFYQIYNQDYTIFLIMGHVTYATSLNFTIYNFKENKTIYSGKTLALKRIDLGIDPEVDHIAKYESKNFKIKFETRDKKRYLNFESNDKINGHVVATITLKPTLNESIMVAKKFEDKHHFYLNNKMNLLEVNGNIIINDKSLNLDNNYALLDWGRGYLPFKHEWIWGSGSGKVENINFGFNIGKFGFDENGSENIFYYDNKAYKLNNIKFTFNQNNPMDLWHYESDCGSFVFTMKPLYDNHTKTKVLFVKNECHQIFGLFNGCIIVDGKKIEIKDFLAFTERAINRW